MPSISGESLSHFRRVVFFFVLLMLANRDRRKLTFYFVADRRIDFRELVRELFR